MDAAPDWVGRKYPDSLFVDISGKVMRIGGRALPPPYQTAMGKKLPVVD